MAEIISFISYSRYTKINKLKPHPFIYVCDHLFYLREIAHDACYLAQPNKGRREKVATATKDAAP